MNLQTGIDLDTSLINKITKLLSGEYKAISAQEDAQLRELAFWRWVACEGYDGKSPKEFFAHQKKFMEGCYAKTGWSPIFNQGAIFELGCGPLGMIEFLTAKKRYAFDPLNDHYSRLFENLRSSNIHYINDEDGIDMVPTVDLGICFNVLDHTDDADYWFDKFFGKIKLGGYFVLQINTVKDGYNRTDEHKKMHPSPLTYEQIVQKIEKVSVGFHVECQDIPSVDNEFFFMAWGVRGV